jgi:hypothetical protein
VAGRRHSRARSQLDGETVQVLALRRDSHASDSPSGPCKGAAAFCTDTRTKSTALWSSRDPVMPRNMLVGNILQELNNPGEHSLMFIERTERV